MRHRGDDMRARPTQHPGPIVATLSALFIALPLSGCTSATDSPGPDATVVCLTPGLASTLAAIESKVPAGSGVELLVGGVTDRGGDQPMLVIAALMRIPGSSDQVGVWATRALGENPPLFLSVNWVAKHWSSWPDAARVDAPIFSDDPSVAAAIACLNVPRGATGQ